MCGHRRVGCVQRGGERGSPSGWRQRSQISEVSKATKQHEYSKQYHTFSFPHPERLSSYSAFRSYKGFCTPGRAAKHHHQRVRFSCQPFRYCNTWNTSKMLTFPRFAILFVSFLLMCLSMLVSPRDMRTACQKVSAPRATPTVLQIMRVQSTINKRQSGVYS